MKVIIQVVRNNTIVANKELEVGEDVLQYKRERNFNLEHSIGTLLPKVVEDVCKQYDEEEAKK